MELVAASHGLVVVAVWVAAWAKVCGAVWHSGLTYVAWTRTQTRTRYGHGHGHEDTAIFEK